MKQMIHYLQITKKVKASNILYINIETDYLNYPTITDLDKKIRNEIANSEKKRRFYLFVDEVQAITGREKFLNAYRADDNLDIDIFITGSNATLLSSDLTTFLAGRYIEFEILPFSYPEFLGYFSLPNTKESFLAYQNFSGISELYDLSNEEQQINFLKTIKDSIILKDVVKKYAIKDIDLLEKLFLFLSNNIGNLFSLNSIVKKLKNLNISSNTTTLGNYLNYLEKTYILHSVPRYDLKGKRILEGEMKYYLNDLAFNNFFTSSYDI
jgi:predicted AAA+ superfamily ATPase